MSVVRAVLADPALPGRLALEAQHIHPHIALEESWEHISDVAQHLIERCLAGKAVLTVTPGLN